MSQIGFNNINKYKQVQHNIGFKSEPENYYAVNAVPQGVIPDVQYQIPQQPYPFVRQQAEPQVQIPDIYTHVEEKQKSLAETVKQVDMVGMVSPWFEDPLLMGGTALGLSMGIDKFTEACGGTYKKSILGKATALGDRIENSSFVKKGFGKKVFGTIGKGISKANDLLNKSALIRAIRTTPAQAEWQTPKSELISQKVRILEDLHKIVETLHLEDDKLIEVNKLGLNKSEKEMLKKAFKVDRLSKIKSEELTNWILLKRLNLPESEMQSILAKGSSALPEVKTKILQQLGFTIDELKDMKINPENYIERVRNSMLKTGKKVKIGAGHFDILGPLQVFERTISCDQIGNRLHSIMDGAKTRTGKFFAQAIQKIHRGFTFGGGKLGMCLWIAPSVLLMIKNTIKAEREQKVGTAVYGSIEAISWVFTFPLAIQTMYALAGMQNAGLKPDQVKTINDLVKTFNERVLKGEFNGNKALYKEELKKIETTIKGIRKSVGPQNLFTKFVKKVWSVLNADLGMIKPYRSGNIITDVIRKIPNALKNTFGVPIRFILCAFVIESFYRGLIEKGSHLIFGGHYDNLKQEENEAKKKEQKKVLEQDLQRRMYELQKDKVASVQDLAIVNNQEDNLFISNENALNPSIEELEQNTLSSANNELNNDNQEQTQPSSNENKYETLAQVSPKTSNEFKDYVAKNPQQKINETVNPQKEQASLEEQVPQQFVPQATQQIAPEPLVNTAPTTISSQVLNSQPKKSEVKPINQEIPQPIQQYPQYTIENVKTDNYTYIPSSENVVKPDGDEIINKYIPSQQGVNYTNEFDNSHLADALNRADRAEQRAIQILNGNFNGM